MLTQPFCWVNAPLLIIANTEPIHLQIYTVHCNSRTGTTRRRLTYFQFNIFPVQPGPHLRWTNLSPSQDRSPTMDRKIRPEGLRNVRGVVPLDDVDGKILTLEYWVVLIMIRRPVPRQCAHRTTTTLHDLHAEASRGRARRARQKGFRTHRVGVRGE